MMRIVGHVFRWIAEQCRLIRRTDLVGRVSAQHPSRDHLPAGSLVVVRDGDLEKWACFRCPGGCGEKIQLSLSQTRRPQWSVRLDWLQRPTIEPSIRQLNACRCHFWVRNGQIAWCADSGHRQVPKRTNGTCGR